MKNIIATLHTIGLIVSILFITEYKVFSQQYNYDITFSYQVYPDTCEQYVGKVVISNMHDTYGDLEFFPVIMTLGPHGDTIDVTPCAVMDTTNSDTIPLIGGKRYLLYATDARWWSISNTVSFVCPEVHGNFQANITTTPSLCTQQNGQVQIIVTNSLNNSFFNTHSCAYIINSEYHNLGVTGPRYSLSDSMAVAYLPPDTYTYSIYIPIQIQPYYGTSIDSSCFVSGSFIVDSLYDTITSHATLLNPALCSSLGTIVIKPSMSYPLAYISNDFYGTSLVGDTGYMYSGNYTYQIYDTVGCTSPVYDFSMPDSSLDSAFHVIINSVNAICDEPGKAYADVTGGKPPYTFLWSNGEEGDTAFNLLGPDIDEAYASYDVLVTDSNGCETEGSFKIYRYSGNIALTTVTTHAVCYAPLGTAAAIVRGGTAPYEFLWSTDETNTFITDLQTGIYTVTVMDANGCSLSTTASVGDSNAVIILQLSATSAICGNGGTAQASATGGTAPYTYQWSNGDIDQAINSLTPGIYNVVVTDANGCTNSGVVIITDTTPLLTAHIDVIPAICESATGQANVTPAGGTMPYAFNWSNGAPDAIITNLASGVYIVTVEDNNGCSVAASAYIPDSSYSLHKVFTFTDAGCNSNTGSAAVSVSGGNAPYAYTWNNGSSTSAIHGIYAGTYSVTVTDNNLCSATGSVLVAAGTLSDSLIIKNDTCNASNGSIAALASGGTPPYSFTWSDNTHNSTVIGLSAGIYGVTLTDNSGCMVNDLVVVPAFNANMGDSVAVQNTYCNAAKGAIEVFAKGGNGVYSYSWNTGETASTLTGLSSGVYNFTITDGNGCKAYASAYVANITNNQMTLHFNQTPALCQAFNGTASVQVIGGMPPYSYQWSGYGNLPIVTGIASGTYTVVVTDANNCTISGVDTVKDFNLTIKPYLTVMAPPLCAVQNGSISCSVSGGQKPYSYVWNTGANSSSVYNLAAGNYQITVTDNSGCTGTAQINLSANPGIMQVHAYGSHETSPGLGGTVTGVASGGLRPYNYTWSNFMPGAQLTNLPAGTYTVTVTDANGCSATASTTVQQYISTTCHAYFQIITDSLGLWSGYNLSTGTNLAYLWNFGDDSTSNLQYPSHIYQVPGRYLICLTVNNDSGCVSSYCDSAFYQMYSNMIGLRITASPLSITEIDKMDLFNVYPNPTSDLLYLKTENIHPQTISIYDLNGNLLNSIYYKTSVDVTNLAPGAYLLEVITTEGRLRRIFFKF